MVLLLCSLPLVLAQEGAWVAETSVEGAAAAWSEALRRRGLTVHPVSPIPNDHPALPNTLTLTFEGDAVIRARAVPTRGAVRITRTGWETVEATLILDPPRTPPLAPKARARLALALPEEAQVALGGLDTVSPTLTADTLLVDPARCATRIAEFSASPIPQAQETLRLALETSPKSCQRALLTSLLNDPAMKAPVSAWIVARYHAAPAEERAHYAALGFMIREPDAALEALYDAEDARLSGE
jgi:hypothetical protein